LVAGNTLYFNDDITSPNHNVYYSPRTGHTILGSAITLPNFLYNPSWSWSSIKGCKTCKYGTDASIIHSQVGSYAEKYMYEFSGSMMTDQICLFLNPENSSCLREFSFFAFSNKRLGVHSSTYLGLAPLSDLNGPSFV
jgi:hypothetical protein